MSGGAFGFARGLYAGARWPDHRVGEVQRRTVRSLVVSQALGGLGMSIGIAVAEPSSVVPTSSSGNDLTTPATTHSAAPPAPRT